MHTRVRKAIIPAAGFGTRMLPATKSVPKELLPIVDRPILDYIVAEAFASGIEHIVIVTGRMKGAIEDYFDHAFEIDVSLRKAGKHDLADRMAQGTPHTGSISFIRQQQARGLGHAVWSARQIVGNEPFAVLLPDMLMADHQPCLKSMMELYQQHGGNIVAVERCEPGAAHKFGIVSLKPTGDGPLVTGLVEKPAPGTAPSNLFISGRYILQHEIFDLLEIQSPGAGGEIQLTDAMIALMAKQTIRPFEFHGRTFDCGTPAGFVSANLHMALARADLRTSVNMEIETLATARSAVA
jgi:UTP--glucose-1-phosphate uridylyltransferase